MVADLDENLNPADIPSPVRLMTSIALLPSPETALGIADLGNTGNFCGPIKDFHADFPVAGDMVVIPFDKSRSYNNIDIAFD